MGTVLGVVSGIYLSYMPHNPMRYIAKCWLFLIVLSGSQFLSAPATAQTKLQFFDEKIWGLRRLTPAETERLREVESFLIELESGTRRAFVPEERLQKRYAKILSSSKWLQDHDANDFPLTFAELAGNLLDYLRSQPNYGAQDFAGGKIALSLEGDTFWQFDKKIFSNPNLVATTAALRTKLRDQKEDKEEVSAKILLNIRFLYGLSPEVLALRLLHEIVHLKEDNAAIARYQSSGQNIEQVFKQVADWGVNRRARKLREARARRIEDLFLYAYQDTKELLASFASRL